ncbi:hypothetical protein D3C85_1150610 [compost metagenome]
MPTFSVPRLTASSMAPACAVLIATKAVTPTSSIERYFFIIKSPKPLRCEARKRRVSLGKPADTNRKLSGRTNSGTDANALGRLHKGLHRICWFERGRKAKDRSLRQLLHCPRVNRIL